VDELKHMIFFERRWHLVVLIWLRCSVRNMSAEGNAGCVLSLFSLREKKENSICPHAMIQCFSYGTLLWEEREQHLSSRHDTVF
jgi:hypothetical protein